MGSSLCCFQHDGASGSLTKPRSLSMESTQSDDNVYLPPLQRYSDVQHLAHMTCVQTTTYRSTFSNTYSTKPNYSCKSHTLPVCNQERVFARASTAGLGTILEEPVQRSVRTTSTDSLFLDEGSFGSMKNYKRFATNR